MNDNQTTLVIFGATGDLTHRYLVPAVFDLFCRGLLPQHFSLIGFARREWDDQVFRQTLHDQIKAAQKNFDEAKWQEFANLLRYIQSDFSNAKGYEKLADTLNTQEEQLGSCLSRIFYFATPASYYPDLLKQLKDAHLANYCPIHGGKNVRIVVEKPFGHDLASAKELNQKFLSIFSEDQIYRIDHYLAKETVQNILAFRFANMLFEPMWNNQYIDSIQVTVAESLGVETRGAFYEETGALRDIGQNHLLQLLAAVTMNEPKSMTAADVRASREKLLSSLKPIEDVTTDTVRGQYESYRSEDKVDKNSDRETFVALKVFLDNERFTGVPCYLRTGKKMQEKVSDITVVFKPRQDNLFHVVKTTVPNTITLRLQPNEGISVRLFTKQPGKGTTVVPTQMDFCYRDAFGGAGDEAYSRLLLDVIAGDQMLFTSSTEVEASWQFITPILEIWEQTQQKVFAYADGSWGPHQADELLERDGRKWLAQHIIVCPIHEQHTI